MRSYSKINMWSSSAAYPSGVSAPASVVNVPTLPEIGLPAGLLNVTTACTQYCVALSSPVRLAENEPSAVIVCGVVVASVGGFCLPYAKCTCAPVAELMSSVPFACADVDP